MAKLGLVSPWVELYNEINTLFGEDPQIVVLFDEDKHEIKLYVEDYVKADAISQILIQEKVFGKTKIKVTVIPANPKPDSYHESNDLMVTIYERAFFENPHYLRSEVLGKQSMFEFTYVVFENEVLQYYTDNIGDVHGFRSTLAENIARDILVEKPGVFYCTDFPRQEIEIPGEVVEAIRGI